jgi:hypothetical protein
MMGTIEWSGFRITSAGVLLLGIMAMAASSRSLHAEKSDPSDQERPYVLECFYKAKWGQAEEFIRLFKKNHLPVLKKLAADGRILKISAVKPRYHGTEDGRWDYRVTLVFKNALVAIDSPYEDAIKKQLFADQETFKREEQRRFEILAAHWDLPVLDVDLDSSGQ